MAWAPDYTTTAAVKTAMRVTDTADDAVIAAAITTASRSIDKAANRQFGRVDDVEARYFTPHYDGRRGRWVVPIDDLCSLDGLLVASDPEDDASYGSLVDELAAPPVNAGVRGRPWTRLIVHPTSSVTPVAREDSIEVRTDAWGWTAVPVPIVNACTLQASRLVNRRDSPYGIAGSPDTGSELRLLAKLDPDVAVIVATYVRPWGAV
jgi:hypothetical protein